MNGSNGEAWYPRHAVSPRADLTLTGKLMAGGYVYDFGNKPVTCKRIRPRHRSWLNVAWLKLRGWLRNSGH